MLLSPNPSPTTLSLSTHTNKKTKKQKNKKTKKHPPTHQVLQQLAGINTVMYYTPAILELAGFRDKRSALLVAMGPAAVNAIGTVGGMWLIDHAGRRCVGVGWW